MQAAKLDVVLKDLTNDQKLELIEVLLTKEKEEKAEKEVAQVDDGQNVEAVSEYSKFASLTLVFRMEHPPEEANASIFVQRLSSQSTCRK